LVANYVSNGHRSSSYKLVIKIMIELVYSNIYV